MSRPQGFALAVTAGLFLVVLGGYLFLSALRVTISVGLQLGSPRLRSTLGGATALLFATFMALLVTWGALESGSRVYVRLAGLRVPLPTDVTFTRVVLGLFAVGLDAIVAGAWVAAVKHVLRRPASP